MADVYVLTQICREFEDIKMIEDDTIVIGIHKTSTGAFDAMHESVKEFVEEGWRYLFVDGKYVYGVWRFDAERCVRQEITFNIEMMTLED